MADIQNTLPAVSNTRLEGFGTQRTEKDVLIAQLDELLEQYLHTLDEHEKIRRDLSKQLSSGYMALAQANFHNSSSAVRYGQDCYDERMQAIRKIDVKESDSGLGEGQVRFSTFAVAESHEDIESTETSTQEDPKDEHEKENTSTDQPQPSAETSKPESASDDTSKAGKDSRRDPESATEPTKATNKVADPLRWFGILVPPALRSAQSAFISAVEGSIPQLATIARDLRTQEIEIGRVRKQIKKL
ncbi:Nn.00g038320.m01.CDS01 [Neocucurbitaria sp. VM-36]